MEVAAEGFAKHTQQVELRLSRERDAPALVGGALGILLARHIIDAIVAVMPPMDTMFGRLRHLSPEDLNRSECLLMSL